LIVGGSARAAVESATRAGFSPLAVDAFGDDDTRRLAECRVARPYPSDVVAEAERLPPADWIYVGGLENSPTIIERLASQRRLLGVGGPALRKVRDPESLRAGFAGIDVWFPEFRDSPAGIPPDGTWLWKSRRSAGGLGVGVLDAAPDQFDGSRYFERRTAGRVCGATFLGDGRMARLIGVVDLQTAGCDPSRPFLFGGAVGPIETAPAVRVRLEALGQKLAGVFGLTGLFGVDVVLDGEAVWVLEVNPRYTASVELLEHAFDRLLVADHVRACRDHVLPPPDFSPARMSVGKRIVYSGATGGTVRAEFTAALWRMRGDGPLPAVADIPPPGSTIGPYTPLVTVLATAADPVQVADKLKAGADEVSGLFRRTCKGE
jgi:uncharacterized protein